MRAFLLLLAACDDAATSPCADAYPASEGYGFESDESYGSSVQDALDRCAEAGGTCAEEGLLTREAALCVAEEEGLAAGATAWKAGLTWREGEEQIVWNVSSTTDLSVNGGCSEGEMLTLDAYTGDLVKDAEWAACP